ncbi:hypothetical protein ACIQGZ_17440 [Streptomyces sp. NPDC092296]|uniref:hypothetical protein n=1 Tax=Streptomyces sp. NPDC092296 TaxID=3366012 RepID=UPI003827D174
MTDVQFADLVVRDASHRAPRVLARALRDVSLSHRWIAAIKWAQRDLEGELRDCAGRRDSDAAERRARVEALREVLAGRRREAAALIAGRGSCVPVPAAGSERELRRAAGELAVDRLIEAHRAEFTVLLVEEFERLGVAVPGRVARHLERHVAEGAAAGIPVRVVT